MIDDPSQRLREALEQVTSVTLPRIYREIGRRVAKSPKSPRGLEQHFQAIARLKPAAAASDAAAVAELREVYVALGKAAHELYGDKAVGKDVAPLLADALAKQRSYVESLATQIKPLHPVVRPKRRPPPVMAYAALAIALVSAGIAGYVTLPKVVRLVASATREAPAPESAASRQREPDRADDARAEVTRQPPTRTASPKAPPAAADGASPDYESLVVAFSAEDADRLTAIIDATSKQGAEKAGDGVPDNDPKVLADKLIAEAGAAIDDMSELGDPKEIQEAMERVATKWSDGVRVLAVPLEEDPALHDVVQSRVGGFLTYEFTQANELVAEQYRRTSNRVNEALADAQKFIALAFGGEDDLGRPFRRPEPQRKEMQGPVLSRFKAAFRGNTEELVDRRLDAIRSIRGSQRRRSERLAECGKSLQSEIAGAERQWRSRVSGVEQSLLRLMRDGEEFAAADSVAGFRKMAKEQQSRLAEVVDSESRGLAAVWRSVVTDFVAGVAESRDIEAVVDHERRATKQVEARLSTAISALGRARDDVTSVFAARMDEERKRLAADEAKRRSANATGSARASAPATPDPSPENAYKGPVIPRRFFQQRIVVGMPMDEVFALLGPPDSTFGDGPEPSAVLVWYYYRVKDENTGRGCASVTISRATRRVLGAESILVDRDEVNKR